MKPKSLLSIALLAFVAASLVVLAIKELRPNRQTDQPDARLAAANKAHHRPPLSDGVIAYYFHTNVRCPTCSKIEAYAREAIHDGFAGPLQDGRLRWRVVNYQQPENEHFAADYELIAPTVVLVEISGGRQVDAKNLARVWDLVTDKAAFVQYVQEEVRGYLGSARAR